MTYQPVHMKTNIKEVNMRRNYYLTCTLNYLNRDHTTNNNGSTNETSKVISAQSHIKEENYEALRQFLGWLPEETVRKTFECTTQLAMGSYATLPFRQHFKSRTPQLNVPRIAETFATDTLFF